LLTNDLDHLAQVVRTYGIILCYDTTGAKLAFRYPALPSEVRRLIRNHRRGLASRMAQGDIRLCPVAAHKSEWFYAGRGVYVCPICRRIDAQIGLWKAS